MKSYHNKDISAGVLPRPCSSGAFFYLPAQHPFPAGEFLVLLSRY